MMQRRQVLQLGFAASISSLLSSPSQFGQDKPIIQFGVIADPQYVDADTAGTRYYRNSVGKLTRAIAALNKTKLEFVVTLGDVIDRDMKSYDTVMPLYENCQHETRFVLGNHDYAVDDNQKKNVASRLGLEKKYHAETIKGIRLVYLDGTDVSLFSDTKDSATYQTAKKMAAKLKLSGRTHIRNYNSAIGNDQLTWIKNELAQAKEQKQPVILFCHFPTMPLGAGHNLWNDAELVKLIRDSANVMAYMNGHNHQGRYTEDQGTHYINFKGMVETEKDNAYSIISVYSDRLEVAGEGVEPDRSLKHG